MSKRVIHESNQENLALSQRNHELGSLVSCRDSFDLVGFTYTNYAGYVVDCKSTFGMTDFLGLCLVSWATCKHNSVALSTTEVQYVYVYIYILYLLLHHTYAWKQFFFT